MKKLILTLVVVFASVGCSVVDDNSLPSFQDLTGGLVDCNLDNNHVPMTTCNNSALPSIRDLFPNQLSSRSEIPLLRERSNGHSSIPKSRPAVVIPSFTTKIRPNGFLSERESQKRKREDQQREEHASKMRKTEEEKYSWKFTLSWQRFLYAFPSELKTHYTAPYVDSATLVLDKEQDRHEVRIKSDPFGFQLQPTKSVPTVGFYNESRLKSLIEEVNRLVLQDKLQIPIGPLHQNIFNAGLFLLKETSCTGESNLNSWLDSKEKTPSTKEQVALALRYMVIFVEIKQDCTSFTTLFDVLCKKLRSHLNDFKRLQ